MERNEIYDIEKNRTISNFCIIIRRSSRSSIRTNKHRKRKKVEDNAVFVQQTGKVASVEKFNEGKLFYVEDGKTFSTFM